MVSAKLSDLRSMSEADRNEQLSALSNAARAGNSAGKVMLRARINKYEERYEMSSEEMKNRLQSGAIRETAEIAEWLFYLSTRQDVTE